MKILKYIFLLILLAFFALSVFIATQKASFDVEKSRVIKSQRTAVFNYVNDFRNWENFGSWKTDDTSMQFIYPQQTSGKGGSYSWTSADGDGTMKTTEVVENLSIKQTMNQGGTISEVKWTFSDTLGGTKVTWRSVGQMSFAFKIYSAFHGGANKIIGDMYDRSLANLDKSLVYEIKTYTIKAGGIVNKIGGFYLQQRIVSKISNVPKNIRIMMPKMIYFFKKNGIKMNGRPFVIYHSFNRAKGLTDMSVCVPVDQEIFTSPGSDVTSGRIETFEAVKTTLTGDYSHLPEAWNKASEYMKSNNIQTNEAGKAIEVYSTNVEQEKHPSKWVTDIYIPTRLKVVAIPKPKVYTPITPVAPAAEIVPEP